MIKAAGNGDAPKLAAFLVSFSPSPTSSRARNYLKNNVTIIGDSIF